MFLLQIIQVGYLSLKLLPSSGVKNDSAGDLAGKDTNVADSIDKLVEEIQASVRRDMANNLRPLLQQLATAISQIERALNGGGAGRPAAAPATAPTRGRRGRPPKAAGRPAGAAKAKPGRRGGRGGAKAPRGAMQELIKSVLGSGPKKLSDITKAVMQDSNYKNRPEKSVYTQIIQGIKRIPEVQKNAKGEYALKGAKG